MEGKIFGTYHRAMYVCLFVSKPVTPDVVVLVSVLPVGILATPVPEKAKNKNMVVPTNSPMAATRSVSKLSVKILHHEAQYTGK